MKVIALMHMVKIGLLVWSGLASADNSMELSAEANLDSSNSSTTLENQVFCVSSFNILPVLSVGLTLWFGLASGGNTMNMTERNRPFSKVGKNWKHFFLLRRLYHHLLFQERLRPNKNIQFFSINLI